MTTGYLLENKHYEQDIDFKLLKDHTDNIILEYDKNNTDTFRRFLFGLDQYEFNIGVLSNPEDIQSLLKAIAGFKINLGVWISSDFSKDIIDSLDPYRDNFIFGFETDEELTSYPYWGPHGDIESKTVTMLPELHKTVIGIDINSDYKTIYEENNLKPIKSNF